LKDQDDKELIKEIYLMKRISRFSFAIFLVALLAFVAQGVWASPVFQGTVPVIPVTGGGACDPENPVDMGTATFTPLTDTCTITVDLIKGPAEQFVAAPDGLAFVGDTFTVGLNPETDQVQVCYAYPPQFADKEASIYKLNEEVTPSVWEEVVSPKPVIENGTFCVVSTAGTFALIGKQ
jgi:hypothetical protein